MPRKLASQTMICPGSKAYLARSCALYYDTAPLNPVYSKSVSLKIRNYVDELKSTVKQKIYIYADRFRKLGLSKILTQLQLLTEVC